ncbi:MAG: GTP-binding protein, partial [Firmicutes bacterium]|nr:GTP-binding protein [Bacillota bacterium]
HHHDGDHDADEVFSSWGAQTAKHYSEADLKAALEALNDADRFGMILRAKGIVASDGGSWLHFDFTPGEAEVRTGAAAPTGMLCVIGAELKEAAVNELFGVQGHISEDDD